MKFTEEQLDKAISLTFNVTQAAALLGVSKQAVSDRLFKRRMRERQERGERLILLKGATAEFKSERQRAVEESVKQTIAMHADRVTYPTIESIAQAQGVSVSTVYRRVRKRGE